MLAYAINLATILVDVVRSSPGFIQIVMLTTEYQAKFYGLYNVRYTRRAGFNPFAWNFHNFRHNQ